MSTPQIFSLSEIKAAKEKIAPYVQETPSVHWASPEKDRLFGDTEIWFKMELFQYGGSFKPRGALMVMLSLSEAALSRGVTAVSAGNHAIAVSYAANILGASAKVVMPETSNPIRVQRCQALGAEVILVKDVKIAFEETERLQREEGRTFVHPFEGPLTALGTATVGYEVCHQTPRLDAFIIPVGGGGLAAGMASGIHALWPDCKIYGVEPEGADSMSRSFRSGQPESIESVKSIADSLGAPFALPYSFGLCRAHLEKIVLVDDIRLRSCMSLMFHELKLAVEPAGAASLAALLGPLKEELAGKKVGLIACGSNIDWKKFRELIDHAAPY
ncbi:MAG: threonine/serine dehydratase [Bacteroidota bacterium]